MFRGREAGAAAVEFALLVPLLVLFLFGTIWFGVIFARIQGMEAAAREGARIASIGRDVNFGQVQAAARSAAPIFISPDDIQVSISPSSSGWCSNPQDPITVTVSVDPASYAVSIPLFGDIAIPYTATGTFRCEAAHN